MSPPTVASPTPNVSNNILNSDSTKNRNASSLMHRHSNPTHSFTSNNHNLSANNNNIMSGSKVKAVQQTQNSMQDSTPKSLPRIKIKKTKLFLKILMLIY